MRRVYHKMDGKQLIDALVQTNGKPLRMVYSFLHDTKPLHLINKQSKDDAIRYHQYLEKQASQLADKTDSALQLEIWLEIMRLLHLEITHGIHNENLIQQANRIMHEVSKIYNHHSEFQTFTLKYSTNDRITNVFLFEIKLQLDRWMEWIKKQKTAAIHEFMQDMWNWLEDNSYEEKIEAEIKNEVKLEEIIVEFLATNGIFYYRDILKLIWKHGIKMNVFKNEWNEDLGVYIVLSSTILNGRKVEGNDLRNYLQIEYFRKNLLPLILLQILMMSCNKKDQKTPKYTPISDEWNHRINHYGQLIITLDSLEQEKSELEKEIESNHKKLKDIYNEEKLTENQIKTDKMAIYHALKDSDLTTLDVNLAFEVHRREFLNIQQKINQLVNEKQRQGYNSVLSKIKTAVSNVAISIQIQNEKRKLDYYLKEMTEDLLASKSTFRQEERIRIHGAEKRLAELKHWKKQHHDYQRLLKGDLMKVKRSLWRTKKEIKEVEKNHYGLKNTFKNSDFITISKKDETL